MFEYIELEDVVIRQSNNSDTSYSETVRSKLLWALENGNIGEFEQILENSAERTDFDINGRFNDVNGTILHIACENENRCEFVEVLIRYGIDVNKMNQHKQAPIHVAVQQSDVETVQVIADCEGRNINIKDGDGNTALHLAVNLKKADMVRVLVERHYDIDMNAENGSGRTPLHLALNLPNDCIVRLLLAQNYIDLDIEDRDGKTCREIIEEICPEKSLFMLLYHKKYEEFIELVKSKRHLLNANDGEYTFLQYACADAAKDVAEALLKLGTNPNESHGDTDPPVLIACRLGQHKILAMLLKHPRVSLKAKNMKNAFLVLFAVTPESFRSDEFDYFSSIEHDYYECLRLLLKEASKGRLDIDVTDGVGNTVLHLAANWGEDEMVRDVLNFYINNHKFNIYIGQANDYGRYALEFIKPSILEEFLDRCITTNNGKSNDPDYQMIFDYRVLRPMKSMQRLETEPLLQMITIPGFKMLLQHPVFTSFFHLKWKAIRKFFYLSVLFYFVFLAILTLNTVFIGAFSDDQRLWLRYTCVIVLCVREISQILVSPKTYLKSAVIWLEIAFIGAMIAILIFPEYEYFKSYQRELKTLVMLTSWYEMILLIGRHPHLSTNVEMFKTVVGNFSKFLLWYSILIVVFSFSFYILLFHENGTTFQNPWLWIAKIGEFDAKSISFDFHEVFCRIVFLLFVFLIAIVLLSLLNGVTVSHIQAISEDAEVGGIISRMKLISSFEKNTIVRKYFGVTFIDEVLPKGRVYVFPNRGNVVLRDSNDGYDSEDKRLFAWRMSRRIVDAGKMILKKVNFCSKKTAHAEHANKAQGRELKPELDRNIVENDGKLWTKFSKELKKYKSKFKTVENLSERN